MIYALQLYALEANLCYIPRYMLEEIKKNKPPGLKHIVLYDIACTLHKHLKVIWFTIKFFIIIFMTILLINLCRIEVKKTYWKILTWGSLHHSCTLFSQLSYSPRVVSECGLTDGEGTEGLYIVISTSLC